MIGADGSLGSASHALVVIIDRVIEALQLIIQRDKPTVQFLLKIFCAFARCHRAKQADASLPFIPRGPLQVKTKVMPCDESCTILVNAGDQLEPGKSGEEIPHPLLRVELV